MAQDDMHVVMCKILRYLYYCMRNGFEPRESMLSHEGDMMKIPYSYWAQVMEELARKGYVTGVGVHWSDNLPTVLFVRPAITLEGLEFMQENAMMRKALDFLKEAKSTLPFL